MSHERLDQSETKSSFDAPGFDERRQQDEEAAPQCFEIIHLKIKLCLDDTVAVVLPDRRVGVDTKTFTLEGKITGIKYQAARTAQEGAVDTVTGFYELIFATSDGRPASCRMSDILEVPVIEQGPRHTNKPTLS